MCLPKFHYSLKGFASPTFSSRFAAPLASWRMSTQCTRNDVALDTCSPRPVMTDRTKRNSPSTSTVSKLLLSPVKEVEN